MLILGKHVNVIMLCMCAFETSLASPNFVWRMLYTRLYPSDVNVNPFIEALTLEMTKFFRHENYLTAADFDLSIFACY